MNRASWIGVGLSSIFIFNKHYGWLQGGKTIPKNSIRKVLFFSTLIILSAVLIIGLNKLKYGSSTGRLLIWEVTSGKILQKPIFGHGVGRFEAQYNNWQADYFKAHPENIEGPKGIAAGNTIYCFNEYLEMASETGIFGLILFSSIILMVFLLFKKSTEPFIPSFFNSLIPRYPLSPFFYSLLTLLICALVSFPFYSLPTLILFFMNLASISAASKENLISWEMSFSRKINLSFKVMTFLLFIFISTGIFLISKRYYLNNSLMNKGVKLYQRGHYQEASQCFQKRRSEMQYDGTYLQFFGKALSMNGEHQKSLEIFEKARLYTSDEVLYTNLGLTCDSLKRYTEAEWAYHHAAAMAPHRLYPLYLLTNHYKAAGQYEQAITTAGKIISKKIKVQSMATDQIIREMKTLLEGRENIKEKIGKGVKSP
jgi:tetratricopeptide (TPR) repeat protein